MGVRADIYLFVWVDIDVAFDALLSHISPTVSAHPFTFTFGTFVFAKASLLSLVWR